MVRGQNKSCSCGFSNAVHFNKSALLKIVEILSDVVVLKVQ